MIPYTVHDSQLQLTLWLHLFFRLWVSQHSPVHLGIFPGAPEWRPDVPEGHHKDHGHWNDLGIPDIVPWVLRTFSTITDVDGWFIFWKSSYLQMWFFYMREGSWCACFLNMRLFLFYRICVNVYNMRYHRADYDCTSDVQLLCDNRDKYKWIVNCNSSAMKISIKRISKVSLWFILEVFPDCLPSGSRPRREIGLLVTLPQRVENDQNGQVVPWISDILWWIEVLMILERDTRNTGSASSRW